MTIKLIGGRNGTKRNQAEEIRRTKPVWGAPVPSKKYIEVKPPEEEVVTPDMFAKLRQSIRKGNHEPKADDVGTVQGE